MFDGLGWPEPIRHEMLVVSSVDLLLLLLNISGSYWATPVADDTDDITVCSCFYGV